jgi:hypothetical protein
MWMLVECKLGPTTQTIGTRTYEFKLDAAGRAACDVGSDHLHIFLARARVYRLAGAISEPMSQNIDPVAPGFRDSLGENLRAEMRTSRCLNTSLGAAGPA